MPDASLTRRTLLRGAAGGAALLATHGLPAWARVTSAVEAAGLRRPDSLPFPRLPAGTASMPKIEHVVVLIMENHSFDNLLGLVPYQVRGRSAVDGLRFRRGRPCCGRAGRDRASRRYTSLIPLAPYTTYHARVVVAFGGAAVKRLVVLRPAAAIRPAG